MAGLVDIMMESFTEAIKVLEAVVMALKNRETPWKPKGKKATRKRLQKPMKSQRIPINIQAVIRAGRKHIRPPIRAEPI